jgi:Protein of unknown function (DUF3667)
MIKDTESNVSCKNCNSNSIEKYCSNCGQKVYSNRFTTQSLFAVFLDAFNVEKGFLFTFKMLFVNPEKIIREYLNGRTRAYMNPLKYFIIIAGISAILMVWFNILDENIKNSNEFFNVDKEAMELAEIMKSFVQDYMNVLIILMLPVTALISKWYFKKQKLNYAEHLILISYLGAQSALIGIFIFPIYKIFPVLYDYMFLFAFLNIAIYYTYGFKSIFKNNIIKSFFGALIINYLGQVLFLIIVYSLLLICIMILKLFGLSLEELLRQ